jgi:hypothetical protein
MFVQKTAKVGHWGALQVGIVTGLLLLVAAVPAFALVSTGHVAPEGTQGWKRAQLPTGLKGVFLHGVTCSYTSCLAFGQLCPSNSSFCGLDTPQVTLASTDSGTTWTRATVPAHFEFDFAGTSCPSRTWCVAGGVLDPQSPTPTPAYALTRNLGATWTVRRLHALGTISTMTCATPRVCYAVGASNPPVSQIPFGQIAVTTNAGGSWTTTSFPTTGIVTGISCASKTSCMANGSSLELGSTVFLRTTTTGAIWLLRGESLAFGQAQALDCPGASECLVDLLHPSDVGSINMTRDGGKTWSNRSIGRDALFYGASCSSLSACTFVGVAGNTPLVSPTSLKNRVWPLLPISRFGSGRLWAISCEPSGHCVAVGQHWHLAPPDGGPQIFFR